MHIINIIKRLTIILLTCLVVSFSVKAAEPQSNRINIARSVYVTSTSSYEADLWARIRSGFTFGNLNNQAVRKIERAYTRYSKNIYRIAVRSEPYLYHIVGEIERRGMPTEIALLPVVESAFKPNARSKRNAVGLWQFIPSTGRMFGLKQNKWRDDRKDVIAATRAALDYLQYLHKTFGDWKLVLAAYNWGEGALSRLLAKNRKAGLSTKFHHLALPRETRNHVYKLIAIKNIITNPESFGIKFPAIPNQPYFEQVETNQHINISLVATLANISVKEFRVLNPAYKQSVVRVSGASGTILLPINKVDLFLNNLSDYNNTLASSKALQITRTVNDNAMPTTYSMRGVSSNEAENIGVSSQINQEPITQQPKQHLIYVVKKGDTFYGISKRYGVPVKQLKIWNNGDEKLKIGQELILMKFRSNKKQAASHTS